MIRAALLALAAAALIGVIYAGVTAIWQAGYDAKGAEQTSAALEDLRAATAALKGERDRQDKLAGDLGRLEAEMRQATTTLKAEARKHAEANAELAQVRLDAQLLADWNAGQVSP